MSIKPQARGNARALVGAVALGSTVGLAIGAAYLAGGMAREAVVHAQIQRLAGTASTGFSQVALDASAASDPGALAIARRHDLLASADLDPRQRRIADLVDRLGHNVSRGSAFPQAITPQVASPILRASFTAPVAAAPFQLRGALDESRDRECLSQAVYYEARGETTAGQAAVAQVVLNRVRHPAFPKSVCAVVFQGARTSSCQFSFACDGASHHPIEGLAWRRAEEIAAKALGGGVMSQVGNATHFHVAGLATGWGPRLMQVAQIGSHVFYRFGGHAGGPGMFHSEPQPSEAPKAMEIKPVFASLAPNLPTGAQASEAAGRIFNASAAVVEHAAAAVENVAKSVGSPDPKPATVKAPPAAPAPVSDDTAAKTQPAV